ncbi:Dcp1p-Dcp2p decapping enzyme complex alpha subunit [Borealophlyctis nickersoniae]|nr:Dcp1p-Dcp2p decapping enzyme complex alpha subunit [Borealophlyctis nickersoniae]
MSLPKIPGYQVDNRSADVLRRRVADLFQLNNADRFPGAQPISFASHHLEELERENYFVSEKADGIRCLLFTTVNKHGKGETFLIDRKNTYYYLDLGLPVPGLRAEHWDTVLDGELVLDVDNGREILWFLLFDCIIIDGKSLTERPYTKRLGYLKENVLKPYGQKLGHDPGYAGRQPFKMALKELQLSYGLNKVFDEIPHLKHKSDGIIFTSSVAPYSVGTCDKMLKWKPSDENTVDFKVMEREGSGDSVTWVIGLWRGGRNNGDGDHERMGVLTLEPSMEQEWRDYPPIGRIVECRYDPEWPGRWRFCRFRDDKDRGNYLEVYNKIMQSIQDNVSKEQLLEHAPSIRREWKIRNNEPL